MVVSILVPLDDPAHGAKRLGGDVAATHLRLKDLRRNSPK